MAKHIKKTVIVDAEPFTAELGGEIAAATTAALDKKEAYAHKSGITFEPGRGFRLNGQTLAFGDYLVTSNGVTIAMSAQEFADTYEPKGGK